MSVLSEMRRGRRAFLAGLFGLALAYPISRLWRVRSQDFAEKDGWILRKDDLT